MARLLCDLYPDEKGLFVSGRHHGLAFQKSPLLATDGVPVIFNSDQGCQFTSADFTQVLKNKGIKISMDGKGRWVDKVFIERLWRSLKYEDVYLKAYDSVAEAKEGIGIWMTFYNQDRRHASLERMTLDQVYYKLPSGLPEAA
ncbi:MAG: transposase [Nitrospirae bacterium]|nr:transposase [Candidatus Manganitrophaceae bacterium]